LAYHLPVSDRPPEGPDRELGPGEEPGRFLEIDPAGVIEIPIGDVIDLHGFRPAEIPDVVRTYLDEAWARGHRSLRLIHGRGIGVQRAAVRRILAADPRVLSFGDAPGEHGGWGATLVTLREANEPPR